MENISNFREIMRAYPDAKVILTTRDPVKWYSSVKNTIYNSRVFGKDPLVRIFTKMTGFWYPLESALRVSKGTQ